MAQGKVQIQKPSISDDLIFQIWIDNNLEHLVRDYKQRVLNFLSEYIPENKNVFNFKVQKLIFAYFEEKSENSSDYYLYNTYGGDLIREIADRLVKEIQELTPKTDEPSTKN